MVWVAMIECSRQTGECVVRIHESRGKVREKRVFHDKDGLLVVMRDEKKEVKKKINGFLEMFFA